VAASVLEAAKRILGFSVRSKNLKGTYVKLLRDASAAIAAGTTVITQRITTGENGDDLDVMEILREEYQQLLDAQREMERKMEDMEK
ncbi:hypothetical protein EAI_08357, partial [Harpegnathos saltator]